MGSVFLENLLGCWDHILIIFPMTMKVKILLFIIKLMVASFISLSL